MLSGIFFNNLLQLTCIKNRHQDTNDIINVLNLVKIQLKTH